jgi:hypothetical protein
MALLRRNRGSTRGTHGILTAVHWCFDRRSLHGQEQRNLIREKEMDNKSGELAIARRLLLRTREAVMLALEKRSTCATSVTQTHSIQVTDFCSGEQKLPHEQYFLCDTVFLRALQWILCCYSGFCAATVNSVLLQYALRCYSALAVTLRALWFPFAEAARRVGWATLIFAKHDG